jgi:hypothetical protein
MQIMVGTFAETWLLPTHDTVIVFGFVKLYREYVMVLHRQSTETGLA